MNDGANRCVVVLTPNPAVDVTYRVDRQRLGVTQRVTAVARRPGGKGINVVRVLRTLGVPALSLAPLGGTAGAWIDEALGALGIQSASVPIAAETRTTVTVVDGETHPTMLGEPGPAIDAHEWEAVGRALAVRLASATALVVSGSLPPGTEPGRVGDWVRLAREAGVPSVIDVSGPPLLAAAEAGADVVKPNRDELLEATGAADERSGAAGLLTLGARCVVVTRGSAGLAAYTPDRTVEVPPIPAVDGNPTGAGDAATAGLVAAMVAGAPLLDALQRSAAVGAAAVMQPVAGEVDPADVERFVANARRD